VHIQWYGHSCFSLESTSGESLICDPFDKSVGYTVPRVQASVVLVSHDHYDHNNIAVVEGNPRIIDQPGEYRIASLLIKGFPAFHDDQTGEKRGENTVYRVEAENLSIIHCGDLGALPPEKEVLAWGKSDIVLVPVGEIFTFSIQEAKRLIELLDPRIVVPMHYYDERLAFELHRVEPFLSLFSTVQHLEQPGFEVRSDTLPSSLEVWVLRV